MVWLEQDGQTLNGWALFLAERLGLAPVVAGVRLFRDTRAGYRMSLAVQAIQILRVYGGTFLFAIIIGPRYSLISLPPDPLMGRLLGFGATLYLTLSHVVFSARGIGINVLALVASWELLMRMPHDSA